MSAPASRRAPRKLVVAALIRQDGSRGPILMSRRRADQALPLLWEFPGGKVEPGEAPEQALAREVREELGCGVAVGRIHDVVFHAYPDYDVYLLVYPCTIVDGTPERRRGGGDRLGRARAACRRWSCCPRTIRWRAVWPPRAASDFGGWPASAFPSRARTIMVARLRQSQRTPRRVLWCTAA